MMSTTRKQAELLRFITEYIATNGGVSPSFDEMAVGVNLVSKSGVHRMLTSLEKRGLIRRLHRTNRCIEVIDQTGTKKRMALEIAVRFYAAGHAGATLAPIEEMFMSVDDFAKAIEKCIP